MNQEKIGNFIATCRKEKGLTQLQLAEELGVTDRSVSNWENGKCMPDLSLFNPLCEKLGITINEFLAGERITKDDLGVKTEKSMKMLVDIFNKKIKNAKIKLFLIYSILTMIILFFIVDFIGIFIFNRPVFAIKNAKENVYRGLLYDTYICPEYSVPQIKLKGNKFNCSKSIKYQIRTTTRSDSSCDTSPKLYYDNGKEKVYLYCLDKVEINDNNKYISLLEYLKKYDDLSQAVKSLDLSFSAAFYDGGTTIYRDSGKSSYSNEGITLIKCQKMLENGTVNNDIYFGPKDMEFKSNYCTNNNQSFIRTYKLENIKHGNEEKSYYLTLSEFQGETDTVLVYNIFDKLKVGKNYEFEFSKIPSSLAVDDKIDEIFKNTKIISIKETDKIGLAQRQEEMN